MDLPNASKPHLSRPNANKPDSSKPDVSKPDVSKPDLSKPKSGAGRAGAAAARELDTLLTALVAEHAGVLFRVAYSILRDQAEAEDAVQDALLRVVERKEQLAGIRDMRVWLVRIVWNGALDRRRRMRPGQMDASFVATLAAPGETPEVAVQARFETERVFAAIDRLPRLERQALLLGAVEELGTEEIAAVLGRSDSAVRALMFRARTRLRQRLKGEMR